MRILDSHKRVISTKQCLGREIGSPNIFNQFQLPLIRFQSRSVLRVKRSRVLHQIKLVNATLKPCLLVVVIALHAGYRGPGIASSLKHPILYAIRKLSQESGSSSTLSPTGFKNLGQGSVRVIGAKEMSRK